MVIGHLGGKGVLWQHCNSGGWRTVRCTCWLGQKGRRTYSTIYGSFPQAYNPPVIQRAFSIYVMSFAEIILQIIIRDVIFWVVDWCYTYNQVTWGHSQDIYKIFCSEISQHRQNKLQQRDEKYTPKNINMKPFWQQMSGSHLRRGSNHLEHSECQY